MLYARAVFPGLVSALVFSVLFGNADPALAGSLRFGERLCADAANFHCLVVQSRMVEREVRSRKGSRKVTVKKLDTWESLWPDPVEREIVMKINRMNVRLRRGMVIAVPNELGGKSLMDFSPLPYSILSDPPGEKVLLFDPVLLAWGAYDRSGELIRWGPGSGGAQWCADIESGCRTRSGSFRVMSRQSKYYRSGHYPVDCEGMGCSPMPYAVFFAPGFAFHASNNLPGYNASHGCVRVFMEDAEWINREFSEVGMKVIVRPYLEDRPKEFAAGKPAPDPGRSSSGPTPEPPVEESTEASLSPAQTRKTNRR